MTVDPETWAYVSGCDPEHVAGNIAAYLESEIIELELCREAAPVSVVARAAGVTPPPIHKAQGIDGEGQ